MTPALTDATPTPAGASGRTMQAIVRDRYGSPDVLSLEDVAAAPDR